jgi:DNA-binding SARP family transcriptional activator
VAVLARNRERERADSRQCVDYCTERLDKLINAEPMDEKLPNQFLDVLITRANAAEREPNVVL